MLEIQDKKINVAMQVINFFFCGAKFFFDKLAFIICSAHQ